MCATFRGLFAPFLVRDGVEAWSGHPFMHPKSKKTQRLRCVRRSPRHEQGTPHRLESGAGRLGKSP